MATLKKNRKVNLFLLGGMRSGTTSLHHYLSGYREIFPLPVKEPHYFTKPWPPDYHPSPTDKKVEKFLKDPISKPAHIMKIHDSDHYQQLIDFESGQHYLLEASTSYLHGPGVCKRLHDYNPEARIIILLRNPWSRAFSHYRMNVGLGKEERSWEEVLLWEMTELEQNNLSWYGYLGMSAYDAVIKNYQETFKQVHVMTLEELEEDPDKALTELCRFLELPFDASLDFKQLNRGRDFFYQKSYNFLKRTGIKSALSRVIPSSVRRGAYRKLSSKRNPDRGVPNPPNAEKIKKWLRKKSSNYYDRQSC